MRLGREGGLLLVVQDTGQGEGYEAGSDGYDERQEVHGKVESVSRHEACHERQTNER